MRDQKRGKMKKFYCPYCGERTLTCQQKFSGKRSFGVFAKTSNRLWFTCPNCHNEVNHKSTNKSKKHYNVIIPVLLVLLLIFFCFSVADLQIPMYVCLCLLVILSFLISFISYNHDLFVRKDGVYQDNFINAEIKIENEHYYVDDMIFLIKPHPSHLQKTNLLREYIVAVNNCNKKTKSCNFRMIKPDMVPGSSFTFDIYCDDEFIGKGKIQK